MLSEIVQKQDLETKFIVLLHVPFFKSLFSAKVVETINLESS